MRSPKPTPFLAGLLLFAAASGAAQQAQPVRLTLEGAIQRGLQAHLRVLAAETRVEEAAAARERRFAHLLPRTRAEAVANLQNRNLAAFGISFPGVPEVVGPFSNYDFRVYGEVPLFDRQSYHAWKASERLIASVEQDSRDARDTIVRLVAGLYLSAQAAGARVEAAQSRVTTAEALHRLAVERRHARVATGVDVLRAQVELANAQQRLLEARNAARQARLVLARNIGLSPGTLLELAEPLAFRLLEAPPPLVALREALARRADYLSLLAQREALVAQQKASRARYLPRLSISGSYGFLGRSVGDVRGTGLLQAGLSLTVVDRDRQGEQRELESRLRRLDHQIADLRLEVELELREALLTLESAAEEVAVARQGLSLAERELELARERFQAGVANNIEVISAQSSVARAQENHILAVVRHTDAKMALVRALGAAEQNYRRYLEQP